MTAVSGDAGISEQTRIFWRWNQEGCPELEQRFTAQEAMLAKNTGGMEKMQSCLQSCSGRQRSMSSIIQSLAIRSAEQSGELSSVAMGRITSFLHIG